MVGEEELLAGDEVEDAEAADVVVVPRDCTGAELTDVTGGAKLNGEEPLTAEVEDAPKKDDL